MKDEKNSCCQNSKGTFSHNSLGLRNQIIFLLLIWHSPSHMTRLLIPKWPLNSKRVVFSSWLKLRWISQYPITRDRHLLAATIIQCRGIKCCVQYYQVLKKQQMLKNCYTATTSFKIKYWPYKAAGFVSSSHSSAWVKVLPFCLQWIILKNTYIPRIKPESLVTDILKLIIIIFDYILP